MSGRTVAALVALLLLAVAPPAGAQLPAGLVAEYQLDGSGSDSSGNGLDGVPTGAPVGIPDGRFGSAFRFGGGSDGFAVPPSAPLQPPAVTLVAWVRSAVVPSGTQTVVGQGARADCAVSSYGLQLESLLGTYGLRFYVWQGTFIASTAVAPDSIWDGAWHRLVGTYDGTRQQLWVDGVAGPAAQVSGPIAYGLDDNRFTIGRLPCATGRGFTGDVDEVLVFNRGLSPAEVTALPGTPAPAPTPTPTPTPAPVLDSDGDGIPDAQDTLPPGNLPPIAGERVQAAATSGDLLVKLPGGSGFVALKGTASLPVGTVVDARDGSLTVTSAAGAKSTGNAKLAAGIFKIRQDKKAASTDLLLQTPAGDARACAPGRTPPKKGVVRSLSVTTAKGVFRTVAAKGTIKGQKATWVVSDTCAGTLTQVKKGKVSVQAGKRTKTLTAGQRYLIKARLFAARQKG